MLLYCDDVSSITDEQFQNFIKTMPCDRREQALRYVRESDRFQSAVAYALLCYVLSLNGYEISDYTLLKTPNGKPYLDGCPLKISISHTEGAVACAISSDEVGVDIQKKTDRYHSVAKRVCTENEIELLTQSDTPVDDFAKLWTLKESYVKCIGTGISDNLKQYDFSSVANGRETSAYGCGFLMIDGGRYILSSCSSKPITSVKKISISEMYENTL